MRRLFRGLRRAPDAEYDVVVIGAGIGGLMAANLLARGGMRALLVEQHYMVGGYCSTFKRAGYTFDAATHFYPILGNPRSLTGRLLQELGVTTGWVQMDPVDVFHFPDGSKFEVPPDSDTYRARLKAEFPAEAAALDGYFAEVEQLYLMGLLHFFRDRELPNLRQFRDMSVQDAMDRHFQDRKLKLLLTADSPHWGSPPGRVSHVFDSILRVSYFLGNYYPRGGSQAFADELARTFEQHGGHVLTSTAARRIVVEGGAARGVELEVLRGPLRGPIRVRAGAVVSNSDMMDTMTRLVGREHCPPELVEGWSRLRPSCSCFITHLGLRDVAAAELEAAQGHYWDSWDADQLGRGAFAFKVFVPTLYEPAMAPPGGQVVIVQKVMEVDYERIGETGWERHKETIETFILERLRRLIPRLDERIVHCSSASAQTAWRFTSNYQGAMLGWEMAPDQLGAHRPPPVAPVADLHFVGAWTRPGGGINPVIVSAQRLAARLLRPAQDTAPAPASAAPHP